MTSLKNLTYAAAAIMALASQSANAAVIGTVTHLYGDQRGQINPAGNDALGNGFVTISDQSSQRFSDTLDFSNLAGSYSSIDSLDLTLSFTNAGPRLFAEAWLVRIQGSAPGVLDDLFIPLFDGFSPQTVTLSLATDFFTVNAFMTSVANQALTFWFSEVTWGSDSFQLNSATLTVNGTPSPVPLPAAGFLMLAGLAGLAGLRRRKAV